MHYTPLGKTNIKVSVASLGSGGFSKIGQNTGKSAKESQKVVSTAIERGINLVDTSELYGTEDIVGRALSAFPRQSFAISTKAGVRIDDKLKTGQEIRQSLEGSLKRLRTDYVDVYHMHGVARKDYDHVREELVPILEDLKSEGKIRSMGITEGFASDTRHETLSEAVKDDCWDVMMLGFNVLNQTGRELVLDTAQKKGIGILDMFAVRHALIHPENLQKFIKPLIESGKIDGDQIDPDQPLQSVIESSGCQSLTELAYRFCLGEPGIHSILVGTGNLEHLVQNIADIEKGPLPEATQQHLKDLFANVDDVSGQ